MDTVSFAIENRRDYDKGNGAMKAEETSRASKSVE